jgi:putative oxidoreductase
MLRFFRTDTNAALLDLVVFVLRLSVAGLMITHGYPKLLKLFKGGEINFSDPIGLGPGISLGLVVFAEFICSILIGLGFGTRFAAIPLIITMSIAAFIVHASDPIGGKEKALLFLVIYLVLLVTGSRKYSLDYLIAGRRSRRSGYYGTTPARGSRL